MSETATPTPPRTAAQVSPILKRVENTGSAPAMVTSSAGGCSSPPNASRTLTTSSNAVATSQSSRDEVAIMPRRPAEVYTTPREDRLCTRTSRPSPICSPPGIWSWTMKWQIGDVTVTKIVELETTGGSRFILPQATREAILPITWLIPHFADEEGRLKMSIHALIIEAPGRRIIVDTCLGNDKKDRRIPTWNDRQGRFL